MLAHHPLITASDRLYFAYGSNLSPEQMDRRCPDSIFLGKATLRGHRWQVNERGVANIVGVPEPAPKKGERGSSSSSSSSARGRSRDHHRAAADTGPVVEGLLYAISAADERRLDRYEGVAKGRYEKFEVQVGFEPVRGNVFARCTSASVARAVREEREQDRVAEVLGVERRARSWDEGVGEGEKKRRGPGRREGGGGGSRRGASVGASSATSSRSSSSSLAVGNGGLRNSILGLLGIPTSKTGRTPSPSPARGRERAAPPRASTPVAALVYASTAYVLDGEVGERYVPRMERAVADAMALGVSGEFVKKSIVPVIPEVVRGTRPAWKSSRRKSLAGGEDGSERDKGRREVESMRRRSVSQSDGLGRRGRRDSVLDRRSDY